MGVSLLVVPRTISVEIASIVASLDSQFAGVCPPVPPSPVALEVVARTAITTRRDSSRAPRRDSEG